MTDPRLVYAFIVSNAGRHPVVRPDTRPGSVLICGAGPTLGDCRGVIETFGGDVWAANSAVDTLAGWGIAADAWVAIDPAIRPDEVLWRAPPSMTYYLASSVAPGVVWWVEQNGGCVRFFHNERGLKGEATMYDAFYPETVTARTGRNVTSRAVDVALYMGYESITLAGAGHALGPDGAFYAGGWGVPPDRALVDVTADGRTWQTTGDMLDSAHALVQRKRAGAPLTFLGDTLLTALDRDALNNANRRSCISQDAVLD